MPCHVQRIPDLTIRMIHHMSSRRPTRGQYHTRPRTRRRRTQPTRRGHTRRQPVEMMIRVRRKLLLCAGNDLVRPRGQVFPVFVLHLLVPEDVGRTEEEASNDTGHDLAVVVVDDEFTVF